jgi:phospholipid-binding lipoprotein MlaA
LTDSLIPNGVLFLFIFKAWNPHIANNYAQISTTQKRGKKTNSGSIRRFGNRLSLIGLIFLQACASIEPEFAEPRDPYEALNRNLYAFNEILDEGLVKPISQGYQAIMPQPLNQGVSNFFNNLDNITTIINSLLQNKLEHAGQTTVRFILNSTVGMAGLMDIATDIGIPKYQENFTQTLGLWGIKPGPYIVLPLLGSSTATGVVGYVADWWTNPLNLLPNDTPKNSLRGLSIIDQRATLLPISRVIDQAIDPYTFVRDAYLQRQRHMIKDGETAEPDDWADEPYND